MNRRSFFKSCGGAIAALMLPFGVKMKLSAPKKAKVLSEWYFESKIRWRVYDQAYLDYLQRINSGHLLDRQREFTDELKSITVSGKWIFESR